MNKIVGLLCLAALLSSALVASVIAGGMEGGVKSCIWLYGYGCAADKESAERLAMSNAAWDCSIFNHGVIVIFDYPIYCVYDLGSQEWCCTAHGYCCTPTPTTIANHYTPTPTPSLN